MSIGRNIKDLRTGRKLTQEKLAEMLGVSFQAVSSWERDEYNPTLENVLQMTRVFNVSSSAILEDRLGMFKTKDAIYNWDRMKTFLKATAKAGKMGDTAAAIDFAVDAHEGQKRKNTDIPYIYHPFTLACHALAMGIRDDAVVAACLLHDVIEDCGKKQEDLPVGEETRELVELLTMEKDNSDSRKETLRKYYRGIRGNPKAALIKCLDRVNNITTMSWGLSRERIVRMIEETEEFYPALLKVLKKTMEYNDAAWLLQYQMESMLDIYKRLL